VRLLSFSRLVSRIQVAHAANPRHARATFFAVLAIVVVLLSIKYAAKISKPGDTGLQTRSAFLRWRTMINNVFQGENIYVSGNEYPNPPIMAILLKPFAALPPVTGAMSWFFAKVLMAVLAAMWVFRLCRGRSDDPAKATRTDLAFGAAIVLCLPALLGDLSHNNVNIFILFLVVATLEAFRRGWDVVAGLTLALAVACKVTPLLFVAYFAWKRCWRVLFASLAGLALWLAVVPGLTFGWDQNRELMTDWYSLMIERPLLKGEITTEHPNQAITGYVYRLFTHSPSFVEYPNNILTPAEYHNIADIGRPAAWVVVKALTALFALAVVCLCWHPVRKRTDSRHGWRFAAECGFICLGMLLFSERTWKHHTVVLLLPLAALAYAVAVAELPRRVRNFIVGVLCASLVLMAGPGLLAHRAADLAMVYGTHTIALVLQTVAVGLLLACRSEREEDLCGLHETQKPAIPN
jgi:hypothetical protein